MKKFLVLVLSAVMACGTLAGCGGGGKGENTLWIGYQESGYGKAYLEQVIANFEAKYPEYDIVINRSDKGFSELAKTEIETDYTKEDLLLIDDIRVYDFARAGKLVEISDVYAESFGDDEGNTIDSALLDGAKALGTAEGPDGTVGYYSISTGEPIQSLVLNRTVADYYEGLSAWGSKKKFDSVKTVADLNTWVKNIMSLSETYPFTYLDGSGSGPVKGYSYPGKYPGYFDSMVSSWWVQYSGYDAYQDFFAMENADVYKDIGRLKAFEAFESLDLENTAIDTCINADHIESQNLFVSGRAVLIPNGAWIAYESKGSISSWGATIEMVRVPYIDSTHKSTDVLFCGGGGIGIIPNREDTNVELAKKFLAYYMNYESSLLSVTMLGSMRPYYREFSNKILEDASVSEFAEGVLTLRKDSDVLIYDVPKNATGNKWKLVRTGTTSKWRKLAYMDYVVAGHDAPSVDYQTEISESAREWDSWLQINNLTK